MHATDGLYAYDNILFWVVGRAVLVFIATTDPVQRKRPRRLRVLRIIRARFATEIRPYKGERDGDREHNIYGACVCHVTSPEAVICARTHTRNVKRTSENVEIPTGRVKAFFVLRPLLHSETRFVNGIEKVRLFSMRVGRV